MELVTAPQDRRRRKEPLGGAGGHWRGASARRRGVWGTALGAGGRGERAMPLFSLTRHP